MPCWNDSYHVTFNADSGKSCCHFFSISLQLSDVHGLVGCSLQKKMAIHPTSNLLSWRDFFQPVNGNLPWLKKNNPKNTPTATTLHANLPRRSLIHECKARLAEPSKELVWNNSHVVHKRGIKLAEPSTNLFEATTICAKNSKILWDHVKHCFGNTPKNLFGTFSEANAISCKEQIKISPQDFYCRWKSQNWAAGKK